MLISVTSTDLLLPINYIYLNLSLALLIEHVFSFSIKPLVWKWKEKTTFFVHSLLSLYYNGKKKEMFMFKVCRKMCVCVLFNLDCRSKSIWHLKKFFVIHKSTVALCLRLCLFFRTFYRKYANSVC